MTEERSCKTCGLSSSNSGTGKLCRYFGESCNDYNYFSNWQPISKSKVQHTKEEWANIINDLDWNPDVMVELEQKGYIRKSSLVELVEEAEWIYENYQSAKYCLTTSEALEKNYQALQALKKDHPEFGGKK